MEDDYWEYSVEEYWKPIVKYPEYEAGTFGHIRRIGSEDPLRPRRCINGYLGVVLCIGGVKKNVFVHKLIAETWIPNPDNKPCVGFKDSDKMNVRADNLIWETRMENGLRSYRDHGDQGRGRRRFKILDLSTGETYENATEAAKALDLNPSCVQRCANRTMKTYRGHKFIKLYE